MLFHEGTKRWQMARMRLVLNWPVQRIATYFGRRPELVHSVISQYRNAVKRGAPVGDITKVTIVIADMPDHVSNDTGDETFSWADGNAAALVELEHLRRGGHALYEDMPHEDTPIWRVRHLVPPTDSAHVAPNPVAARVA